MVNRKVLRGKIINNNLKHTLVVCISYFRKHKRYGKYIRKSKNMMIHILSKDRNKNFLLNDLIDIQEYKPFSKRKSWIFYKFVNK